MKQIHARAAVAALALAGAVLGGCGADRTPVPEEQKTATARVEVPKDKVRAFKDSPFEHSWDLKLPGRVHTSWISENQPELVYFQIDGRNEIYGVDVFSGRTRFVTQPLPKPLALPAYCSRVRQKGPTPDQDVKDDRLWVISDDTLFCFDAVYGQLIYRHQLPFSPASGAMATGPEGNIHVYIGSWDGRVEVVSYQAGTMYPYVLWQWNLYSPVRAQPVHYDGLTYVADLDGALHCFRLDREKTWSFRAGGAIYGSPLVRGREVYIGTGDNVFYALNRLDGTTLGSVFLNAPVRRQPFHFRGDTAQVYVYTNHRDASLGGLHALRTRFDNVEVVHNPDVQGRPRKVEVERFKRSWFAPAVSRLISSTPEHLYMLQPGSTLVQAVNKGTGETDWAWDLDDERRSEAQLQRPLGGKVDHITEYWDTTDLIRSIITADKDGQVVAYRLFGYRPQDMVAMGKAGELPQQQPAAKPADAPKPADGAAKPADGAAKPADAAAPAPAPAADGAAPAPAPAPAAPQ